MLEFLRHRGSDRKLRLFAVACCRTGWHLLKDDRSRRAVEQAEWYAEGQSDDRHLWAAENAAAVAQRAGMAGPGLLAMAAKMTAARNLPVRIVQAFCSELPGQPREVGCRLQAQ